MATQDLKKPLPFWKRAGKAPGSAKPISPVSPGNEFSKAVNDILDAFTDETDDPHIGHSSSHNHHHHQGQKPLSSSTSSAATTPARRAHSPPPTTSTSKQQSSSSTSTSLQPPRRHTRSASDVTLDAAMRSGGSGGASAGGSAVVSPTSPSSTTTPCMPTRDELRLGRFTKILESPVLDMEALRTISWNGIPSVHRATVWGLLSGYIPANVERRATTLTRKREEYASLVTQYYGSRSDESHQSIYHQIHIDVLRTNPSLAIFQQPVVQEILERILYIWAIRHPASGYVQGINDLVLPFFATNLSPHISGPCDDCDVSTLDQPTRDFVEADCYWGLTKLLDGIQDNYTFASPRIQKNIKSLRELVARMDRSLHQHLEENNVEYLQFSFRWMNCLLLRELPLPCVIRLWDTYHSEVDGFASFHLYTCAAFLLTFSKELKACSDFQSIMIFLQNLPTSAWTDKDIELVVSEAYRLKYMFHDAMHHLQ